MNKNKSSKLVNEEKLEYLSEEKFSEIYTDKSFRNAVAFPHSRTVSFNDSKEKIPVQSTFTFPIKYIVSNKQIIEAQKERGRDREKLLSSLKAQVMFIKKGASFSCSSYDVGYNKISTVFKNLHGVLFYVEISTLPRKSSSHFKFKCTSAIVITGHVKLENYMNLETVKDFGMYTKKNVLTFINQNFKCCFTKIEFDEFTLSDSDLLTYYNKNG